ncbi:MAG UNVERIFIED_CONTAM: hypothetical protein LVQ98_03510 [Rickettsiaceae bacterium]
MQTIDSNMQQIARYFRIWIMTHLPKHSEEWQVAGVRRRKCQTLAREIIISLIMVAQVANDWHCS